MAHETLKATIRQYIGPNGQNSITGQIMQDILIAMVDEYPNLSGYATQSWVTSQLAGYATTSQLAGYLPLTGGNISGNLTVNGTGYFSNTFTVQSIELGHGNEINSLTDGLYNLHLNYRVSGNVSICYGGGNCGIGTNNPSYKLDVNGSANATTLYENGTSLSNKYLALTGGTLTGDLFFSSNGINRGEIFGDEYGLNIQVSGQGKLLIENAIEADSTIKTAGFIKNGGTSSQFLKADGSVDSNTYITASALTGYATQSWVTTQLGSYLPLAGGTITGNLTVNSAVKFNSSLTFAYDRGIYFGSDDDVRIMRDTSRLQIVNELGADIIIGDYDNRNYTSIVNDLQGGTTDSTYSSVTQKWLIQQDGTAQFKSVSQTSDVRKKTIIDDVLMDLDNVANAPLFKFTWKGQKNNSSQHIGTSAQYWQNILPELVSVGRDADMTLAIQYDVIALASAITVAKTVVDHEARIRQLEEKIK